MFEKIIRRALNKDGSVSIDDPEIIKSFTDDPDFSFLVSFPRTGSHWLRMIMELYFEMPSLIRAFYFKNASKFTCYHTHDNDLELRRRNVIYLYRDPVETIYSQLSYYKEDPDNQERRQYWTNLYARHLSKWLVHEEFTRRKTVITYEGMKSDIHAEFEKVCKHYDKDIDRDKLDNAISQVTKEKLKNKTRHDQQVVNLSAEYQKNRMVFTERYSEQIYLDIYSYEPEAANWFTRHNVAKM